MLREAHKKGLMVIIANSEALPFRPAVERVIMIDAFHHVAQHQLTLDEIWRLKAGRWLVIEEPNIRNIFGKLIAIGKNLAMRSKIIAPKKSYRCAFQMLRISDLL